MFIIYDLVFLIFALICLPIYFFRKKFHAGFLSRLGSLPKDLSLDRPIWCHAVSVGEAMVIRGLLDELRKFSNKRFVISTVTAAGNKIARSLSCSGDFVTYLPLDLSFIVRSVIDRINPGVFIIAETEIWPNLISYLYRKKIPIITVNGRISDGSFKGYLAIKYLLKPVFRKVNLFCVQTERDAQRLICLGVPQDKVKITGNMKFDIKEHTMEGLQDYRLKLRLGSKDRLLVAGSTHPREEEMILRAYKELRMDFGSLKLLIAPRHPERSNEVAQLVSRFGFRSVFISAAQAQCPTCMTPPVFILDTVGHLPSFYAIADVVFVGGSLVKKGGHNILEPAACAKPILFGPHMFNFRDIADLFLDKQAAIMAQNQDDLKANIKYLLDNPEEAAELGKLARHLITENRGATGRNLDEIRKIIACFP